MAHPALALRDAVERLRAEHAARYPVRVDSTVWSYAGGAVLVEGAVLVPAQADDYQRALRSALGEAGHAGEVPRPPVLSDLGAPFALQRWAPLQGRGPADVYRGPEGDELQTQWCDPAVVRVFVRAPGAPRALVQIPDGTVGWVGATRVGAGGTMPSGDPWARYVRPGVGRAVLPPRGDAERLATLARARLGRPYRWGGNTKEAADCSGFVQSVVHDGCGVLLPKHTRDQMQKGARVAATGIAPGDLVFVRGREHSILHVGLAVPGGDGAASIVHSCLSRAVVLEEDLPAFLDRYAFTAARRVLDLGAAP